MKHFEPIESHPQSATARKKPGVAAKAPSVAAKAAKPAQPVAAKAPVAKAMPAAIPAASVDVGTLLPRARPEKKTAKTTKAPKAPKAEKPAKVGSALVRDSFTMPEDDFKRIATLKARALKAQRPAKKSELLRAGLHVLEGLTAAALVEVLNRLVTLKPGRPKKHH